MVSGRVNIIVPVYNQEKYLSKCIDSIISQRYKDIELLIIDGGSVDNTINICKEYEASDNRIRVIRKDNSGIGSARNTGIGYADGEYIMFVDSDDYLPHDNVIHDMVSEAEKTRTDIICGNYCRLMDDVLIDAVRHGYNDATDVSQRDFRFRGFFSGGILSYVWCKLYRRSFIADNGISFGEYSYAEDKMFNFMCYVHGAVYGFVDENVYVYRKNTESVSWQYAQDRCSDWMAIINELDNTLQKMSLPDKYRDLETYTLFFAIFFDAKMQYEYNKRRLSQIRGVIKQYMGYEKARTLVRYMAKGRCIRGIRSVFWKIVLFGFGVMLNLRMYCLISIGIKMLVDLDIDGRLSSTGRKKLLT